VKAALTGADDPMAEGATPAVAGQKLAAAWAHQELDRRQTEQPQTGRRIFILQSMTANGIRSAAAVQHIRVLEARTPTWSLTAPQEQMPDSILLARLMEPSEGQQASAGVATTAGAVATAGVAGVVGVGEDGAGVVGDGALASAARTGDSPGVLGGTVPTGMVTVLTGMVMVLMRMG
jgi:hypothetical protein